MYFYVLFLCVQLSACWAESDEEPKKGGPKVNRTLHDDPGFSNETKPEKDNSR